MYKFIPLATAALAINTVTQTNTHHVTNNRKLAETEVKPVSPFVVGEAFPGIFDLLDLEDLESTVDLEFTDNGKLMIIDVWQPSCPPCLASMAYFDLLREESEDAAHGLYGKLEVYGVSRINENAQVNKIENNEWDHIDTFYKCQPNDSLYTGLKTVPSVLLVDNCGIIIYWGKKSGYDFSVENLEAVWDACVASQCLEDK